jgi:SAM-dependent methyltransferase
MRDVLLAAARAADRSTVRVALDRYLAEHGGDVYTDPAAFQRFVDGGGNVGLYAAAAEALRGLYAEVRPRRLIDVGCGDGRLSASAVGPGLERVDLVEPSGPLLDDAVARLDGTGPEVVAHRATAQELLAAAAADAADADGDPDDVDTDGRPRWDVAQSTFALHTLDPGARRRVLAALARTVGRLVVIEFDVPEMGDRTPEHAAYAVDRYAAGIAEYDGDELVVQGFLMPVLVGQFDPAQPRHTWEQPIDAWADDLVAAGFATVDHHLVHDYWWAPAHLLTATPAT